MATLPASSVDLVLCDPPYGTTRCAWDMVIDLAAMWAALKRVCRPGATVVFTAAQPFTSALVGSNMKAFRYSLVWEKNLPTGFLNSKRQPLRAHEDIVVFSVAGPRTYNPQGLKPCMWPNRSRHNGSLYGDGAQGRPTTVGGYPRSVLRFDIDRVGGSNRRLHPTQKPVALFEYLTRTYSNAVDTVLDFAMGSGTTGVACVNAGRRFIGIELDPTHFETARSRIAA